jgi:hypothetical protein
MTTVMVLLDRRHASQNLTKDHIKETASLLAKRVLQQETIQLSKLLATDGLDRRAAQLDFIVERYFRKSGKTKIETGSLGDVADFFMKRTRGRMLVLGASGTGKTVLATKLIVDLLRQRDDGFKQVPILFSLADWDPEKSELQTWMTSQVSTVYQVNKSVAERLVQDGWIMPVLDGLDEIIEGPTGARSAMKSAQYINDYIAASVEPKIVITCRAGEKRYNRIYRSIRDCDRVELATLSIDRIIGYLEEIFPEPESLDHWKGVIQELTENKKTNLYAAINTPWRLVSAVSFYFSGGNPDELLPKTNPRENSREYRRRISRLLMDAFVKTRFGISRKSPSNPNKLQHQLHVVADILASTDANYSGSGIVPHLWWKALGYRSILFMSASISFSALGFCFSFWDELAIILGTSETKPTGMISAIAIVCNYGVIKVYSVSAGATRDRLLHFDLQRLKHRRSWSILIIGFATSCTYATVAFIEHGPYLAACFGLSIFSVIFLAAAYSPLSQPKISGNPGRLIWKDRWLSLGVGLTLALLGALYYSILFEPHFAATFSLMILVGSFLSGVHLKYAVAAVYGTAYGLPLRFNTFLRQCHQIGLLRTSGSGYQFRHPELQFHLLKNR